MRAKNSVSVAPGHSANTRTPVDFVSCHSASVKDNTNALVAPYTAIPGVGWKAAVEATLITSPRPAFVIAGRNNPVSSTSVPQFSWICAEFSATPCVTKSPCRPTPALLMRMSTRRPRVATWAASSAAEPGTERSAVTMSMVNPGCCSSSRVRNAASLSSRRATRTRLALRLANATAKSSPMPPLEPVISAVWFSRFMDTPGVGTTRSATRC